MCLRVSEGVCDIDSGFSQSDGQAEWLIGARQSDLGQGEHTQSYSSRSNRSTVTQAVIWVMLYRLPCMRALEKKAWHSDSLGVILRLHAIEKERGSVSWKEYWQLMIDTRLYYSENSKFSKKGGLHLSHSRWSHMYVVTWATVQQDKKSV